MSVWLAKVCAGTLSCKNKKLFWGKTEKIKKFFVLDYKNIVLSDGNGFKLCKKHVKSRLNVKNMTKLKKNIA